MTIYYIICACIFIVMILWGLKNDQDGNYAQEMGPNMSSSVFWMITLLVSVPFVNLIVLVGGLLLLLWMCGADETFDDSDDGY